MATTKITSPDLFNLDSLNTELRLPSGTTAQRPTSPSAGEWRFNTSTNLLEMFDGSNWFSIQDENIPPINSENFNTVLYTGNGSTQSITGVGFKPDWIWIKERTSTSNNVTFDSTRGIFEQLYITTDAESNNTSTVSSFDTDGFSVGSGLAVNENGQDYVAWCWKVNGGTTSSNTDGTITSTVQANTKAGFSIVSYTGDGANGTVGHGLGVSPEIVLVKRLNSTGSWSFNGSVGGLIYGTNKLVLQTDAAITSDTNEVTAATSTTFTAGTSGSVGASGGTYVAYCFSSVAGYSSIGSYTGNGSTSGPIINTGFEPAWLMVKGTSNSGSWIMFDNKRTTTNPRDKSLRADSNAAETTSSSIQVNFLTNGFQLTGTDTDYNGNGRTYLYIAFAADPSAAPTLADSFAIATYSGNNGTQSIAGLGFAPSLTWIKNRSSAASHSWTDIMRGNNQVLQSNETVSQASGQITLDSDGFTLGSSNVLRNEGGQTYVSWNWKAAALPTINTDGTDTSIVSANVAAGFSIAILPNKAGSQNLGHGLDGVPDLIIMKQYEGGTGGWTTYNSVIGARNYMNLNTTAGNTVATAGYEYDAVTATTITNLISGSTYSYIYYCFKNVAGFSKVGSYSGNSSTQSITGLGFRPSWVMIKRYDGTENWYVQDSARGSTNQVYPNLNSAEFDETTAITSFDSDGWTMGSYNGINNSGESYIFLAFKENPAQYAIPSGEMGYLVAAGGGGSSADSGGGAGAGGGGLRTTYGLSSGGGASAETNLTLATGTYTITVGAGGTGTTGSTTSTNGVASTITGNASVSTVGGGGGGDAYQSGTIYLGKTGGSGGGSGNGNASVSRPTGGAGTANEGFAGGGARDYASNSDRNAAGGGGGSASVGITAQSFIGGNGGFGLTSAITGSNISYAGGGGGGCRSNTASNVAGQGFGGGGNATNTGAGNPGTANTGGGAGGGRSDGAAGGSGVVILRLNTSDYSGVTSGAPTITTIGSETILKYTASGGYAHNYNIPAGSMAYLVVAGGGGSGNEGGSFTTSGAGGGAGGLRTSYGLASGGGTSNESFLTLSAGTYTITIGAGGGIATNGSASTITGNGSVATVGGGGGGQNSVGSTGGSGGGGGSNRTGPIKYNGGAGTTGEGFGGSIGDVFFWSAIANDFAAGGGGGGAASAAVTTNAGTTGAAGEGGNGLPVGITGSNNYYSAGGGGFRIGLPVNGLGHHSEDGGSIENGQPNTGDGAPKWSGLNGFSGGSGVVVLRIKTTDYSGTTTGSPTVSTDGSDTVLTFTGSGTYVHS